MVFPAAGFVGFLSADEDDRVVVAGRAAVDQPLRAGGRLAADDADGVQLDNFVGAAQQLRHRAEGLAAEIQVEPGDHDTQAALGKPVRDFGDRRREELRLVDGDDGCFGREMGEQLFGVFNRNGFDGLAAVAGHALNTVAVVDVLEIVLCSYTLPVCICFTLLYSGGVSC